MTTFQLVLRLAANLILLFGLLFSCLGANGTSGAVEPLRAPESEYRQVWKLYFDATAALQGRDDPFGSIPTVRLQTGEIVEKWLTVQDQIKSEGPVLSRCLTSQPCSAAARRFLEIVAEGRGHHGLARAGLINRAVNLSIIPTSDMKQWGVPDRWSPPLETLSTGRGDCEDYAIVKYAALLQAGVRQEDVKVVILNDLRARETHAVAVVRIDAKWIVLDNRWLALVQDAAIRRVSPNYVLDYSGIREFVPDAEAARVAALSRTHRPGHWNIP